MAIALPRILPTARAAVLIALAAPLALVIAAVAPAAWIAAPALGGTLEFQTYATIVADQLNPGAEFFRQFFPAVPIILSATVFDRDDRKTRAKLGVVIDQFFCRLF